MISTSTTVQCCKDAFAHGGEPINLLGTPDGSFLGGQYDKAVQTTIINGTP